jgi:5-methylcytosine-specific restriction protein A
MQIVRGNGAISRHAEEGKDLHLFVQAPRRSHVTYVGQFVSTGMHTRRAPDLDGHERSAIVFELTPIDQFQDDELIQLADPSSEAQEELRQLAELDSADSRAASARVVLVRYRSAHVRRLVLHRAAGKCEGCKQPAPFITTSGEPYLEAHHIRRLSDGGPDRAEWVVALCANCHRRAHHSADAAEFNQMLAAIIQTQRA